MDLNEEGDNTPHTHTQAKNYFTLYFWIDCRYFYTPKINFFPPFILLLFFNLSKFSRLVASIVGWSPLHSLPHCSKFQLILIFIFFSLSSTSSLNYYDILTTFPLEIEVFTSVFRSLLLTPIFPR